MKTDLYKNVLEEKWFFIGIILERYRLLIPI
jgi:hypothetical protein